MKGLVKNHIHPYSPGGEGGHGAILQHPGSRVILVLSDMLSTKIDVGALDFTGLVVFLASKD